MNFIQEAKCQLVDHCRKASSPCEKGGKCKQKQVNYRFDHLINWIVSIPCSWIWSFDHPMYSANKNRWIPLQHCIHWFLIGIVIVITIIIFAVIKIIKIIKNSQNNPPGESDLWLHKHRLFRSGLSKISSSKGLCTGSGDGGDSHSDGDYGDGDFE